MTTDQSLSELAAENAVAYQKLADATIANGLLSNELDENMRAMRLIRVENDELRHERDRYKKMAHESVGEIGSALVNAERQRDTARSIGRSTAQELIAAQEALRQIADMPEDRSFAEAPAAWAKDAVNIARQALGREEIKVWP